MGSTPKLLVAQLNQICLSENAPQSPSIGSRSAEPLHSWRCTQSITLLVRMHPVLYRITN